MSREDQLLKLRSEVEGLESKFKMDKLEFEGKEKLQNEAFNVSICFYKYAHIKETLIFNRLSRE